MYKNIIRKKILTVCVICFLMLLYIPLASGEDIRYPKDEGPYNVSINGKCSGMGGGIFCIFLHFSPLWYLIQNGIAWHFDEDSVFIVNDEKQDIEFPAQIYLRGFKGYGQSYYMLLLKDKISILLYTLTGLMPYPRARVIGKCYEILVSDSS